MEYHLSDVHHSGSWYWSWQKQPWEKGLPCMILGQARLPVVASASVGLDGFSTTHAPFECAEPRCCSEKGSAQSYARARAHTFSARASAQGAPSIYTWGGVLFRPLGYDQLLGWLLKPLKCILKYRPEDSGRFGHPLTLEKSTGKVPTAKAFFYLSLFR